VRWLSLCEAINCVHDSFSLLILGLEHELSANPRPEGSQKARGILKKINNFKFVSVLSLLKNILQELNRISKLFQSDTLDIATLKINIQALTYDHPNGFTYLQLGRDFINLFLFKYMAF